MKKNLSAGIFFLALSFIIIFSWFGSGLIFGGGDVGLQTYDPFRVLERAIFVWWDSIGPGTTIPQGLTAVPLQFLLSLVQLIGFSPVLIQAFFFFAILFSMGFGMYIFTRSELNQKPEYALLCGLFYIFNPYMMIQVWHRFVHSSFFLVAVLPYLLIFWIRWLREGKIKYLFSFLLVNLFALYLYGTIAYIVTIWLILFLLFLGEILFPWQGISRFKNVGLKFIAGFLFWFFTNIWWLIPIFTISPVVLSQQHTSNESLVTLINISRQAIIPYSLQMINPFYLFSQNDFSSFYQNFFIRLIPWFFVTIILTGLISSLKKPGLAKWSFIFLILLFLTKGSSSPFGNFFIFGFENFFALGVLRNPFEKIGILLPFVYSIFLVLGTISTSKLLKKIIKKNSEVIPYVVITMGIFIFCWPMFNPGIFGKIGSPAYVKVPESYFKSNQFIENDYYNEDKRETGRILHLPLTRGESISYKWNYGYNGLEPSDLFFTYLPSISKGFNIKRIDDSLTALYLVFHKYYKEDPEKILKLLQDFNVKYIVLHSDVNWYGGDLYDPLQTEKILDNLYFLEYLQAFGDLKIYKLKDEYFKPKITLVSNVQVISPSENSIFWPWIIGNKTTIITPLEKQQYNSFYKLNQLLIFPESTFIYPQISTVNNFVNQFFTDESFARVVLDGIKKVGPILSQNGERKAHQIHNKLVSSTEKMIEMIKTKRDTLTVSKDQIDDYKNDLKNFFSDDLRSSRLLQYIDEKDMSLFLRIHLYSLLRLGKGLDPKTQNYLNETHNFLEDQLYKYFLIPQYPLNDAKENVESRKVFKYQVSKAGEYEILMVNANDGPKSLENLNLSINGKLTERKSEIKKNALSFGIYEFGEGGWEIGYDTIVSDNLALPFEKLIKVGNVTSTDGSVRIETAGQLGYIESPIPQAGGGDIYRVSFEIKSQGVSGFNFQLAQDIDAVNEIGQKSPQINEFISLPDNSWQSFRFTLTPLKMTTQEAAVRLVISAKEQILTPTSIQVRNLSINKILDNGIVLKAVLDESNKEETRGGILSFNQINPVLYKGKVNINKPSFLIFSETYHPGWKLTLKENQNKFFPKEHMMANLYANSYFIDRIGSYEFSLEFEPQKKVYLGVIVAVLSYLLLIILMIWRKFKK